MAALCIVTDVSKTSSIVSLSKDAVLKWGKIRKHDNLLKKLSSIRTLIHADINQVFSPFLTNDRTYAVVQMRWGCSLPACPLSAQTLSRPSPYLLYSPFCLGGGVTGGTGSTISYPFPRPDPLTWIKSYFSSTDPGCGCCIPLPQGALQQPIFFLWDAVEFALTPVHCKLGI